MTSASVSVVWSAAPSSYPVILNKRWSNVAPLTIKLNYQQLQFLIILKKNWFISATTTYSTLMSAESRAHCNARNPFWMYCLDGHKGESGRQSSINKNTHYKFKIIFNAHLKLLVLLYRQMIFNFHLKKNLILIIMVTSLESLTDTSA